MHFVNIATAVALATAAQAFVIPSTSTNGVYAVTIGEDGKEVHTKISDSTNIQSVQSDNETTINDLSVLESRGDGRIWCGCGANMNAAHCNTAVGKVRDQLSGLTTIKSGETLYSIESDVVAFACNRAPRGWTVLSSQYREALDHITGSCGQFVTGATQSGDDGQALILGYARWKEGDNFCGDSTKPSSSSC